MNFFKTLILFFLIFLTLSIFTLPSSVKGQNTSYKKNDKNVLSVVFENELVKGDVHSPDLLSILKDNEGVKNKKIIKLRNNFLPEMKQTAKITF